MIEFEVSKEYNFKDFGDYETPPTAYELEDKEKWWHVFIKFDGCFEITRYFNCPKNEQYKDSTGFSDTLHICDINEFIEFLQNIKKFGSEKFKNEEWK